MFPDVNSDLPKERSILTKEKNMKIRVMVKMEIALSWEAKDQACSSMAKKNLLTVVLTCPHVQNDRY